MSHELNLASVRQVQTNAANTFQNMDTATTNEERQIRRLRGIMPGAIESMDLQMERALEQLRRRAEPIDKYIFLSNLRNTNIRLFYSLLLDHLEEICPIIYTPTVGTACLEYSHIYPFLGTTNQPDGLYIRADDLPVIDQLLDNYRATLPADPQICVITDGSRILGLGDLGINGMGIPVGKLQLYVGAAGLDPRRVLPICLDLGTNTKRYLEDPLYLGVRRNRPDDDEYYPLVADILHAVHRRFPQMLIQFEDFSSEHAFELLSRHRDEMLSFNDDIQGTGAVILSGFMNAIEQVGKPINEHRILFFGAGSAGVGVAKQLSEHFIRAGGMSEEEAKRRFWLVDSKGLITKDRGDRLAEHKVYFARDDNEGQQCRSLEEAIEYVKPTALIGLSSQANTFTPEVISRLAELNEHPILFPLSNPATNAECDFETAMRHSDNRVIFASGTAFPAYTIPGTDEQRVPGQGNNMYIFPGLGLGAVLAQPAQVTDEMIYAAAAALAGARTADEVAAGDLYPRIQRIREVSAKVAAAVIQQAVKDGQASSAPAIAAAKCGDAGLTAYVHHNMWHPTYDAPIQDATTLSAPSVNSPAGQSHI
ncbi:hypothetical protein BDF22DRAFT_641123 [Syncephalis plumigaleata]|nr:hypothetical protein BDF22DRAFT_641123 [Syncephalis plumigaleata]